ncbi:MAG: type II toxin-antitoxin system VapC family toxin [Ignavibacteriales bacterium]|nr:type II toxin-antitoxin system VapC family toxin [Ignavibacteriales bacterium]
MNGNSLLLDTNVILYFLSGDRTLIPLLNEKDLFVSFITQLELLSYKEITETDIKNINEFLAECTIIDINAKIKESVINLKRKYSLKLPDSIIIATGLFLKIPVISADAQFKLVEESDLIFYQK